MTDKLMPPTLEAALAEIKNLRALNAALRLNVANLKAQIGGKSK